MVALGRLTAAIVVCMNKMVAEARRSDQIVVRTQYVSQRQRKASGMSANQAQQGRTRASCGRSGK